MNRLALWRAGYLASSCAAAILTPIAVALMWLVKQAHRAQSTCETRALYDRAVLKARRRRA